MTEYEFHVFILCLIVFLMLTTLSIVAVAVITKLTIRLIRTGAEDENILAEYKKENCKKAKIGRWIDRAVSILLCLIFSTAFVLSLCVNHCEGELSESIPSWRVVESGSMSKKHPKNEYLVENGLDDQFHTFDLVAFYKAPPAEELKLYDIIIYEHEDYMIAHRIVGIKETESGRCFTTQGDAIQYADRNCVHYSQIKGIYRGERVPFWGSFVLFMQSPAGWMCILLILFTTIATPIVERKIADEKKIRLALIEAQFPV